MPVLYRDIKSPVPLKSYEKNLYLPLYYKIKKGDTNYRILKIFFPRDSTEIKKVNFIYKVNNLTRTYININRNGYVIKKYTYEIMF